LSENNEALANRSRRTPRVTSIQAQRPPARCTVAAVPSRKGGPRAPRRWRACRVVGQSSTIVDLNFFGHPNGAGCTIVGVEVFQLAVFCGGGDPENPLVVLNLSPNSSGPTAPTVAVPTLAPLPLASLSIGLAALAFVSLAVARRRARRG
jgi:hypothetical protein